MITYNMRRAVIINVAVCQAGYNANDLKIAYIIANGKLDPANENFEVFCGETSVLFGTVADGRMKDEGVVWGKYVYSIDFSEVTGADANYRIISNGTASFVFTIQANIWSGYRQDFMTFYRMQRNDDTTALMAQGAYGAKYGNNPLVTKGYHPVAFLDDAWDATKTKHYDLVGGWFDAGDFGTYSENQWVTGQMALTYLENMASGAVDFDYDSNGIPDLLDEIMFSAKYSLKMVDAFGGYGYNVQKFLNTDTDDKGRWKHPEKYTDGTIYNGSNACDDRYTDVNSKSVEGSAKMAGTLAVMARVLEAAVAVGKITARQLPLYDQKNKGVNTGDIDNSGNALPGHTAPAMMNFIDACKDRAVLAYYTAKQYDGRNIGEYPRSNYLATKGLKDPLLWAEVELYLLDPVNNAAYLTSAKNRIMALTFNDLQCTNYWNLSSLAMTELYPVIKTSDTELASKIQSLLESRINFFISSANETPYGVLNEFGTFGVNEPHMSYVADTLRYYRLFKYVNPVLANQALKAVKKGLYWVFGNNPWNISWVSGIGTNYTKYIHSRLDQNAQSSGAQQGIILPGALVSGPNSTDTMDDNSAYPWYQDRTLFSDGNQWRYNEPSISIEIGLFYTIMTLSAINENQT